MKKTLIALAVLAASAGSAFATNYSTGSATVAARSVSSTFATAGNGGTSVSKAGNFAVGFGDTSKSTSPGLLGVAVPNCNVPTTATLIGNITTVKGSATTMGGSYASNVSTGNGTGNASAYGFANADVAKTVGGVGGSANTTTETWAGATKGQSNSSYASQTASFEAKGGTGLVVVTEPGKYFPKIVATGQGAVTTGESKVSKSVQLVNAPANSCVNCNTNNPGAAFNGTNLSFNTATGSNTNGVAYTNADVSLPE